MTDLLPQVPQDVEHGFDHALAPRRLLVGKQEQEIDVGAGRQGGAAVAADRDDAKPLRGRGLFERVDVADHVIVQRLDDLVLEQGQARRTSEPAVSARELGQDDGATLAERHPEPIDDAPAECGIFHLFGPKRRDVGVENAAIENAALEAGAVEAWSIGPPERG